MSAGDVGAASGSASRAGSGAGRGGGTDPAAGGKDGVATGIAEDGAGTQVGHDATYGFTEAARILDVPENRLRYWSQVGAAGPSVRRGSRQLFTFQDLVSVKAFKELTDRGIKPARIRKALEAIRTGLPHVDRPLDRLRVAFDGEALVVVDAGAAFEPGGQRIFDFGLDELAARVAEIRSMPIEGVEPLAAKSRSSTDAGLPDATAGRPAARAPDAATAAPPPTARRLFDQGTRIELAGGPAEDAERAYRQAVALDPGLAAAHSNLGRLSWARGQREAARAAFDAALGLDPDLPEARFNLAVMLIDEGEYEWAIAELRRVLQVAPEFADAHYNLAVVLETLGGRSQARTHLERYLALAGDDPAAWDEQARAMLARLGEG